ncbi:MAG: hypothetical protein FWD65_01610 [Coriobacteriia bacterium]|nr:hypothetical protein [Coriobacteriia bacterium]
MMKKMIAVAMAVCLFALAGCGAKKTPSAGASAPSAAASSASDATGQPSKKTSTPAPVPSLQQRRTVALKALSEVMLNKAMFTNVGDTADNVPTRKLYLKNISSADTGWDDGTPQWRVTNFAVIDVNQDGVPEAVAELCSGPDTVINLEGYEVLHYYKSEVYGYFFFRWNHSFAKNGLSWFNPGGVDNNALQKLRFLGGAVNIAILMDTIDDGGGVPVKAYMYDVSVSKNAVLDQMGALTKDQAVWYTPTAANIAQQITNRSASADPVPALSNENLVARQDYLDGLGQRGLLNYSQTFSATTATPTKAQTAQLDAKQRAADLAYYQSWDAELNRIYGLLEKKLPASQMDSLRQDEHQWMTIRDKGAMRAYGSQTKNSLLGDFTQNRTLYLIDLYFGDSSQPTTTDIVNRYGR